ncbi:VUT family protein [Paenibacillus thalictri]|uniref:VUT family protein n=1 Tax=Paenibacillus thalictri TaxID=2527873 RepID=A0A4Q9DN52_9BACL|nr:VUT family protein [Paenibacillus thalictri]TBL75284.1 VUT family protein [Paenibacillus thalictri]
MKWFKIMLYLCSIVCANIITSATQPFHWGIFIIPAGTFIIGATFIFRDLVQQAIGRRHTYLVILTALLLSGVSSYILGDTLWITAASAATFVLSETVDTEVFTRLRASVVKRVMVSGLAGGTVDSAVFVIIGLSPLGAGFLPWEAVPMAILGQMLVKGILQLLGAACISMMHMKSEPTIRA